MDLLDKILAFQHLIIEQTNELPEYYVIDNEYDLRQLRCLLLKTGSPEEVLTLAGSKIIIDVIKEK